MYKTGSPFLPSCMNPMQTAYAKYETLAKLYILAPLEIDRWQ
ncbi:hypothetical protein [Bacillus sonorensis]|nr:hypothetical protein [Bacillus sonorensis]